MNYHEFKRRLMVDPYDRDAAFEQLRREDPDCARAAEESDQFERKLEAALSVPVPANLADELIREQPAQQTRRQPPWPVSMAAGLLAGVLLASAVFWQLGGSSDSPADVERFLAAHWQHDGHVVLANAEAGMDLAHVRKVLGAINLDADGELLRQVAFATNCPTPNGRGVHMVVRTEAGPVTVIYMPGIKADDGRQLQVDGRRAMLVRMQSGSAALIGERPDDLEPVKRTLQQRLKDQGVEA